MNIEIVEVEGTEHVIIDKGNGEFTSMPKAVWDELEAAKENGTIS
jgi:acyl-CoA thioesterase FadM